VTATRAGAIVVSAVLAVVGAVVAWRTFAGSRPIADATAAAFGPLPAGLRPSDLNVIVITMDTTRADRVGAYGDRGASTPHLDRLAAEGVVFEQATSAVPLTLPAHATLFTGLRPPRHGVRDNGGYTLDRRHTTLASALKGSGRATAAFVSAFVLDSRWGLDQGFETYLDRFDLGKYPNRALGQIARRASATVDEAIPWLESHAASPFFAWLHLYDPHAPYDPPEPFKARFGGRPYAGEIAYMDDQIGRVLRWLDAKALAQRTVVVAIGDHGEGLQEHGEGTHGLFLYESTIRVPFIIRTPYASTRDRRVRAVVRGEDLMPTVLDLVRVAAPEGLEGESLASLMTGAQADLNLESYSESLYPRNHYGWSDLRALRSGRFKYIQAPRPELYDLERDPEERRNLYDDRRPLADRMRAALARLSEEPRGDRAPAPVDPETRERLAALGYIGSLAPRPAASSEALADPKDKIEIFNLMTTSRETDEAPDSTASIDRLEAVVAKDPGILDAWIMLGNEYFKRREFHKALERYKRALAVNPDFDLATINLAGAYRALGDDDAAIEGFERYLRKDPGNAWVRYQLGELYLDLHALDKAEAAFTQALSDDTRVASARNALGVVAFKRGDFGAAERQIRAALDQNPEVRLAHFNLALVAEQRGDLPTAIAEYRSEMAIHPDAYRAAFNLARLYERIGDAGAEETSYREAIARNPWFAEAYLYLAKLYVEEGRRLDEAMALAERGLALGPQPEFAPLGHYVLADALNRLGRTRESAQHAARGRALEMRGGTGRR
jgi:arylsulfatase A-like enzyme/Tfp pilus assembly protein PilF